MGNISACAACTSVHDGPGSWVASASSEKGPVNLLPHGEEQWLLRGGGGFVDAMKGQILDSATGATQRRTMFAFTSVRTTPLRSLAERARCEGKWVMKAFTKGSVAGMGMTRRKASQRVTELRTQRADPSTTNLWDQTARVNMGLRQDGEVFARHRR